MLDFIRFLILIVLVSYVSKVIHDIIVKIKTKKGAKHNEEQEKNECEIQEGKEE